jgi:hypothetical protein
MISSKGRHTPKPLILQCVRWYCSYALSYRNFEEMIAERGLVIDHSTMNRSLRADVRKGLPQKSNTALLFYPTNEMFATEAKLALNRFMIEFEDRLADYI